MINCVSLVERERVEIPRACKERRAAMLRVIQEEEEMYTRPASRWRTLNFNTQPLSELAKAVVMAIRAALNAARWLLPLALVAIIKMHYNPSPPLPLPPPLPASSLYPVATGSFPLGGEPLIFSSFRSCFRFFFGEPTVPSAIYSLCRGELYPYYCVLPPSIS